MEHGSKHDIPIPAPRTHRPSPAANPGGAPSPGGGLDAFELAFRAGPRAARFSRAA
eukprot:gene5003-25106_t